MWSVFGWVLLGFVIWALVLVMQVVEKRFAPEWHDKKHGGGKHGGGKHSGGKYGVGSIWGNIRGAEEEYSQTDQEQQAMQRQISDLKERVQVLEAIVTDRRWQFDQEINPD